MILYCKILLKPSKSLKPNSSVTKKVHIIEAYDDSDNRYGNFIGINVNDKDYKIILVTR